MRRSIAATQKGAMFAIGSIVRANFRPVGVGQRGAKPQFLPYDALVAAKKGDYTKLLMLQGSFTVPRSLLEEVGPLLLERHPDQKLALEIDAPSKDNISLEAGAGEGIATSSPVSSSSSSSTLPAVSASSRNLPSELDWRQVPTMSLNAALALHATGINASNEENDAFARAQSRQRTFLDVTELPTADAANQRGEDSQASRRLPVLAPTGTLPPLHALDKELFAAVSRADLSAVRRVLGMKAHGRSSSDDHHHQTREQEAATALDRQALRNRADVLSVHPESGANVMHLAAASWEATSENSRASLLTCLVDECGAGCLLNARAFNGSTPLHWAAGLGHLDAVEWLLGRGADPLAATHTWTTTYLSTGSGQTPAHWAAQSGFEDVAAALLAASPLVSLSYDEKGLTPLALAQYEGKPAYALRAAEKEEWLELELIREDSLCRPL